jgi:hypothetical protein
MRTLVIALFLTVPLAATAAAQDRPAPSAQAPDISYEFEDHGVDGGRYVPEGTRVLAGGTTVHRSLVRPRVHFVPELLKSVERL